MSTKRDIINSLIEHLKLINGTLHQVIGCPFSPHTYRINLFSNVTDQFRFLENINDFPFVSFFQTDAEQRFERGGGEVYATCNYLVRCYFMAEESAEQADDFVEDIQYNLNSFKYTQNNPDLIDLRIQVASSDEQILDPYGLVEISFGLVYRLTI